MNRCLTDIATRYLRSESPQHPSAKAADFIELQRTARLLRSELDQVIEDEVAGDEACEAEADKIVRLRALAAERRRVRDALKKKADEAQADSTEVQDACLSEGRKTNALKGNIRRLLHETRQAAADGIHIRDEVDRIKGRLKSDGPEVIFRLRADVQNTQTECEIEEIRVRELNSQRNEVRRNLEEKRRQLEDLKSHSASLRKTLEEARTKYDINQTRFQFLAEQLQGVGGRVPRSGVLSSVHESVQCLFTKMNLKDECAHQPVVTKVKSIDSTSSLPNTQIRKSSSKSNARRYSDPDTEKLSDPLFSSDQLLNNQPTIYKLGIPPNDVHPENDVYQKSGQLGISIHCKDNDDGTIVSALTIDETEFRNS